MPVVCLEGPSAVGKTATAAALQRAHGGFVVPEVHVLFERPARPSPEWYLACQVERSRQAAEALPRYPFVVLDGDPFQPLWYNWAYGFEGWQGLDALEAFYRPRLLRGEIRFPDRYIVLGAPEAALRERRAMDPARGRRNFDVHLRFIGPQRRYFRAMQRRSPGRVRFLQARRLEDNVRASLGLAREAEPDPRPVALFDSLVAWLRKYPAG